MTAIEGVVVCVAIICGSAVFALIIWRGSGPALHLPPPRREPLMWWSLKPVEPPKREPAASWSRKDGKEPTSED